MSLSQLEQAVGHVTFDRTWSKPSNAIPINLSAGFSSFLASMTVREFWHVGFSAHLMLLAIMRIAENDEVDGKQAHQPDAKPRAAVTDRLFSLSFTLMSMEKQDD
jgi:hypothetical protein